MTFPLNFQTVENRYLTYVYVGIWLIQGGYLAWITRQWFRTPKP